MATIYRVDGSEEEVEPKSGKTFKLDELQAIVGGYIQIVDLPNKQIMVLDEEGKLKDYRYNPRATILTRGILAPNDVIVGDVLVCESKQVK